jgi:hypothetical protein
MTKAYYAITFQSGVTSLLFNHYWLLQEVIFIGLQKPNWVAPVCTKIEQWWRQKEELCKE